MVTTIDQKLAELITEKLTINGWPIGNLVLCVGALLLSVILCGLIGVEREWRGRSAGLRTHLLVGVGSCLIMIISIYGFPAMFGEKRDVARLAAQIITGVGFLGAGVIMHRNGGVKGLTTAGTIWAVMAIGIACGSFNFILALVGTLIIFIVLTVFKAVEAKLNKRNPIIILTVPSNEPALTKILAIA
jgi:putative Mg2+ transporter-C (MgtC) family protein